MLSYLLFIIRWRCKIPRLSTDLHTWKAGDFSHMGVLEQGDLKPWSRWICTKRSLPAWLYGSTCHGCYGHPQRRMTRKGQESCSVPFSWTAFTSFAFTIQIDNVFGCKDSFVNFNLFSRKWTEYDFVGLLWQLDVEHLVSYTSSGTWVFAPGAWSDLSFFILVLR